MIQQSSWTRRDALGLLALGLSRLQADTSASFEVIDVFPAFWEFWEKQRTTPATERAGLYERLVIQPNLKLFRAFTGPSDELRITRYLQQVEVLLPKIRTLHDWVTKNCNTKASAFLRHFPDLSWRGPVVYMPNFFGFNAGTGAPEGRNMLVFGLDYIARYEGDGANLGLVFDHELFHIYHDSFHPEWHSKQRSKGEIPLYWLVWVEGLATYASYRLNPAAETDSKLESACRAQLSGLAGLLMKNLDSTENGLFMQFMSGQKRSTDVPPRAGYYLGMRVAEVVGKGHSLRDLARRPAEDVRRDFEEQLPKLT